MELKARNPPRPGVHERAALVNPLEHREKRCEFSGIANQNMHGDLQGEADDRHNLYHAEEEPEPTYW